MHIDVDLQMQKGRSKLFDATPILNSFKQCNQFLCWVLHLRLSRWKCRFLQFPFDLPNIMWMTSLVLWVLSSSITSRTVLSWSSRISTLIPWSSKLFTTSILPHKADSWRAEPRAVFTLISNPLAKISSTTSLIHNEQTVVAQVHQPVDTINLY